MVQINADKYTPVNTEVIPTGQIASVSSTDFDLRTPKLLSTVLRKIVINDEKRPGFDHNYVINRKGLKSAEEVFVARVTEPSSKR